MALIRPNANQFRQLNYGDAISAGQNIQMNRLRGKMLGMQMKEQQDMLRNRARANEIRAQIEGMPNEVERLDKLARALEADGLYDEALKARRTRDQARQTYLQIKKSEMELMKMMREYVNEDNYDMIRQGMIEEGSLTPGMWPERYSDSFFKREIRKQQGKISKITTEWQGADDKVYQQDLLEQDGNIISALPPREKGAGKGAPKPYEYKPADANTISRLIERTFNVTYDPITRSFTGLDKDKSNRLVAIGEEAARIYAENRAKNPLYTHDEAVAAAMRKAGAVIEDLRDATANNPLNLQPPR